MLGPDALRLKAGDKARTQAPVIDPARLEWQGKRQGHSAAAMRSGPLSSLLENERPDLRMRQREVPKSLCSIRATHCRSAARRQVEPQLVPQRSSDTLRRGDRTQDDQRDVARQHVDPANTARRPTRLTISQPERIRSLVA